MTSKTPVERTHIFRRLLYMKWKISILPHKNIKQRFTHYYAAKHIAVFQMIYGLDILMWKRKGKGNDLHLKIIFSRNRQKCNNDLKQNPPYICLSSLSTSEMVCRKGTAGTAFYKTWGKFYQGLRLHFSQWYWKSC